MILWFEVAVPTNAVQDILEFQKNSLRLVTVSL